MNDDHLTWDEWIQVEQFKSGVCDLGPEALIEALEVAVGGGEMTENEAIAYYTAYVSYLSKDKMMGTAPQHTSFPDVILDGNRDPDEVKFNHKALVNSLTGAMVSAIIVHIALAQRGAITTDLAHDEDEIRGRGEAGAIQSMAGEPTLDDRNAADDTIIGVETTMTNNEELGFSSQMPPLKVAERCDALRLFYYRELDSYLVATDPKKRLLPDESLVRDSKAKIDVMNPINWDQPMSAEMYMKFRIQAAGIIDEKKVISLSKQHGEDGDYIRKILMSNAVRDQTRLKALTPEILKIIEGFTQGGDDALFDGLPAQTQLGIARRVAGYLDKEYGRLIMALTRTTSLDVTTQLEGRKLIMKRNWEMAKKWISEREATLVA